LPWTVSQGKSVTVTADKFYQQALRLNTVGGDRPMFGELWTRGERELNMVISEQLKISKTIIQKQNLWTKSKLNTHSLALRVHLEPVLHAKNQTRNFFSSIYLLLLCYLLQEREPMWVDPGYFPNLL
jgi:hypothetical protein